MPLLLFCRLASMLSAWVVTGLLDVEEGCVDDMARTLPKSSGWALGRAGMPPPAAQQTVMHHRRQKCGSKAARKLCQDAAHIQGVSRLSRRSLQLQYSHGEE